MDDQFWYIRLLTNVKRRKDRVRRQVWGLFYPASQDAHPVPAAWEASTPHHLLTSPTSDNRLSSRWAFERLFLEAQRFLQMTRLQAQGCEERG